MSHGIRLRVWGESAMFSRPEMKVERASYDTMTPSAARGIVEAVYFKPEIRWEITRLRVLNPIRFISIRTNGVGSKIPYRTAASAMTSGSGNLGLNIEDDRQQFAGLALRDVHYIIEARFDILSGTDNAGKHLAMFQRRAESGQCFHRPYLGTREHACHFAWVGPDEPMPEPPESLRGKIDLGYMLHDIDHANGRTPHFFRAVMNDGVIEVPPLPFGVRS